MEELILLVLRVAGYVLYFCLEGLFYQVFYLIGAIPVWVITFGRLPGVYPWQLDRANRIAYGAIGLGFTILCIAYYIHATADV